RGATIAGVAVNRGSTGTSPVATISCSGLVSGHQSLIHRDKPGGVLLQNRARSFSGLSLSFKAQRFLHVAHQAWLFPAQVGDEGLRRWLRAAEGVPHNSPAHDRSGVGLPVKLGQYLRTGRPVLPEAQVLYGN